MAVVATPVASLLNTLSSTLLSVTGSLPADSTAVLPANDGISLLDIKNDLLLSYIQHIVFLILLRLKHDPASTDDNGNTDLGKEVTSKLTELRAYLERGVRPLEGRLRYQIDKVLRAVEDADRSSQQKQQTTTNGTAKGGKKEKTARRALQNTSDDSASGSESEHSSLSDSESLTAAGRNADTDDEILTARPNPAALTLAARQKAQSHIATKSSRRDRPDDTGTYKPPRVNPVSMPDANTTHEREEKRSQRTRKNALLDEFLNEETSSAPTAQPSIGSNNTILDGGRNQSTLNTRDRNKERERLEYEERNFVRLPAQSKAERKKEKARTRGQERDIFGGEDWTGLGGLGERIGKDTQRGRGMGKLDRREKRKRDTVDGPRGDGVGIGETFEKKRRVLAGREEKRHKRR